uniref:Fibronectin type-III domain-containing protein n=1 Tax=Amphimedon queenslandica TaxID=400682 RepID=A0A1X7SY61_AMPQE
YYAKAPTNLTTTFNANGVTLQWEDTGNNCTSTVYQVTVNGTSNSVLTSYNNSKTTLLIHSSELNTTETYTYTVRGWNGQQSNISKPFTLAPHEVMNITINTTNTTDPCKNSCCANVTLNIILESLDPYVKHPNQYHNISYNSNTGNIPVTYEVTGYDETEWTGSGLKYNETYCFTVTPMNNFSTGMPISNDTTTQYSCEPPGNGGDNGDDKPGFMLLNTVALLLGVELILLYSGLGGLNTSILTFNLNHSESVCIECIDSDDGDKMNTTVTDLGYYAKAPTNLTTTFNASGVTLAWKDTGNNCTSTVYQVTVSCSCTSTSVLMYNTSKTAIHINSSDLLENVTYTYTVRGWNEQESNISEPFTLAPVEVMSVTINITNTTDPCKNNICCVNATLNIILVRDYFLNYSMNHQLL